MKILVPGKAPEPNKLRLRCCYCGCIFEVKRGEYRVQPGQYNENTVVVACPWCHETLYTSATETR